MTMAIQIVITMTIIKITTKTVITKIPIGIRMVKTIIMTNEIKIELKLSIAITMTIKKTMIKC